MANHMEKLGEMTFDRLINSGGVPLVTALKKLRSGQGVLPRGAVLALSGGADGDGKLVLLGTGPAEGKTETLTASGILCDETDATAEVSAMVYLSGHFNHNALTCKTGHTLTAVDRESLRTGGIYLDALA